MKSFLSCSENIFDLVKFFSWLKDHVSFVLCSINIVYYIDFFKTYIDIYKLNQHSIPGINCIQLWYIIPLYVSGFGLPSTLLKILILVIINDIGLDYFPLVMPMWLWNQDNVDCIK